MTEADGNDEQLLIDFVLARCDEDESRLVRERLETDDAFRRRHEDLASTFAVLETLPEAEPPAGLVERTLDRIHRERRTQRLLAREEARRYGARPTFSLRELGGIAAAMVLLAAIFIPSMRRARELSAVSRCASNQARIGNALLAYANANEGFLPGDRVKQAHWLTTGGKPVVSNSVGLFKLVRLNYETPDVFQCPAVSGRPFTYRVGMVDFPGARFVQYSYQHMLGEHTMQLRNPKLSGVAGQMAILADRSPIFEGGRFHKDRVHDFASDNHNGAGQNVLYLSGNVAWSTTPGVGVRGNNIFLVNGLFNYNGDEKPANVTDTFLLPAYSGNR